MELMLALLTARLEKLKFTAFRVLNVPLIPKMLLVVMLLKVLTRGTENPESELTVKELIVPVRAVKELIWDEFANNVLIEPVWVKKFVVVMFCAEKELT